MRGFPKYLKTKQDFLNCINEYGEEKTLTAFGDTLINDTEIEVVASYDLNPTTGEMINVVTKTVENLNPMWKRMGFESLEDMNSLKES